MSHEIDDLNEQIIILSREDIAAPAPPAPSLQWSTFAKPQIAIQLKDIEGLAEGRTTVKASVLQRIDSKLLPIQLEADFLLSISLESVVRQLQAHLGHRCEERSRPVGTDFDTAIAQVAREDEDFFKLAKEAERRERPILEKVEAQRRISGPILTPADRPTFPLSREIFPSEFAAVGSSGESNAKELDEFQPGNAEAALGQTMAVGRSIKSENATSRKGLERLREIFMTEEVLDPCRVASLLSAFPKVTSALIMRGNGALLGGNLAHGYHLETALLAPRILRSVREFNQKLRSSELPAISLLGERPVTLLAEGDICILISHEGRGLLPGVRERIGEVARALDALCASCP
jgi:hypothetical protein